MSTDQTNRSTRVSTLVHVPRAAVYRAFLDADAVATWLAPDNMRGQVETFEPRVGGLIRMALTYLDQRNSPPGKTSADTDSFEGRFVELVPDQKIVQVFEFESNQPEFAGAMTITWRLAEADGGTEVTALCEDIPPGIRLEDNEEGSRQSLRKLAAYVERAELTAPTNGED